VSYSLVLGSLTNLHSRRTGRVTYRSRGLGALLSLPRGGCHENAITTGVFQKYIRNNAINWFSWAQRHGLGVQRMEDLILVSGCTLVTSWAAAAFVDPTLNAEISLESRTLSNGGTDFVWSNIQGPVVHHNSRFDPVRTPAYRDVYSICTNIPFFLFVIWKAKFTRDSGSMRLHQGLPSKTSLFFLDQSTPSCSRTPS
jgi:hypothetical protein